jgi:hypothetical protein
MNKVSQFELTQLLLDVMWDQPTNTPVAVAPGEAIDICVICSSKRAQEIILRHGRRFTISTLPAGWFGRTRVILQASLHD